MTKEVVIIARVGDPLSEKAIEVARRACMKALREHGLKAVVIPIVSWSHGIPGKVPVVLVDGRVVAFGRVPREDEVLDALLNPPRGRGSVRAFVEVPAAIIDDDAMLSAAEL